MDEATWLAGEEPQPMLDFLAGVGRPSERKLRLFACACVRRVGRHIRLASCRRALDLAERFADGLAGADALRAARALAGAEYHARHAEASDADNAATFAADLPLRRACLAAEAAAHAFAFAANPGASYAGDRRGYDASAARERGHQAALAREVFGSPFHPLPARSFPAHVVGLARACSEVFPGISPDYLVLADALADLGEDVAAAHCREATHAKGCHILDWVLGRP
jgi:hypothetical protein